MAKKDKQRGNKQESDSTDNVEVNEAEVNETSNETQDETNLEETNMNENQDQAQEVNTTNGTTSEDKEERHRQIIANFNNLVDVKEFKFHFKKMKDEATGVESKRPTVELMLPIPSFEGIAQILTDGDSTPEGARSLSLLQEAVAAIIIDRARELLSDNESMIQDNFPLNELSWATIASLPRAERRGGGIGKEVWEEFAKDYVAIMPAVTNKTIEQVGNAAKIFLNKFNAVKTNKPVLKLLKEQLALYASSSANAETYADCIGFLTEKADNLINMDESALLNNL